jgi:protein-tyrosine phosphatase
MRDATDGGKRADGDRPAVLFVCLGNICRSPLAELAFRLEAQARGLDVSVDSAGTGDWHVGAAPDPRARAEAARHGHSIDDYRARQIAPADFTRFDHIVALDEQNLADLRALAPAGSTARLSLLLDHAPGRAGEPVLDPYHGDAAAFAETWADVCDGARGLADDLSAQRSG